jgi:uncharacterized protein YjiS (DUF1127 family)
MAPPDPGPHDFRLSRIPAWIGFAFGSAGRRWPTFLLVSSSLVALVAAALHVLPPTYEVDCRLLVRSDAGSPFVPSDAAARSAALTVLRHDTLMDLIRETRLLEETRRGRAPLQRLLDGIRQRLGTVPGDEEATELLAGRLERDLVVWNEPGGVVYIRLRWPDPVVGQRLVDAAQRAFVEAGYRAEVASLAEPIPLLEDRAAELRTALERTLSRAAGARTRASLPLAGQAPRAIRPALPTGAANIQALLEANRQAIAELESARTRTLADLQARLAEQRASFSEAYPDVMATRQRIAALSASPPQLRTLQERNAQLSAEATSHPLPEQAPVIAPSPVPERATAARDRAAGSGRQSEERIAARRYFGVLDRLAVARFQLDIAGAAFTRRYVLVTPPELPRSPIRPQTGMVMLSALVAGLAVGVFATTAIELRRGPPVRALRRTAASEVSPS